MAYKTRSKKGKTSFFINVLAILLLLSLLLKFDAVANVVDPNNKIGLKTIADDAFPIIGGILFIAIGLLTFASVWVSVSLIVVGVIMVLARLYMIWKRKQAGAPNVMTE